MTMVLENQPATRSHKGLGIASFVIGLLSVATFVALMAIATVSKIKTGAMTPELTMTIGFGMIAVAFVDLIGLGLGVSGAIDRASKKIFPALGLTLNIAILALFATCLVIGLSLKH